MTAKVFFDKTEILYSDLLLKLEKAEFQSADLAFVHYEEALMDIDQAVRQLKIWLSQVHFTSLSEEVHFFRDLKPRFIAQYLYFSKVLALETAKPAAGPGALKEYYSFSLRDLKKFTDEHQEFYEYYRRGATYLDEKYFVRHRFDFKMGVDPFLYNYDFSFATSHDHLVATILANDRLEKYLLTVMYATDAYFFQKFSEKSPLTWTASKSSLIELLYGLQVLKCFNNGQSDFSETVRLAEKSFNIDLGNFYKTLHEIKARKIIRTKFLRNLEESLANHFEESDR